MGIKGLVFGLVPVLLFAKFASNDSCKKCHPLIYAEYKSAMHSQSTIFKDPIHNAVWKISPDFKKGIYRCGTCHTPADTTLAGAIEHNLTMIPDKNSSMQNDGVSCAYCHRVQAIRHDEKQNQNIINRQEKQYFGNIQNPKENDFHKSAKNYNFKNGNICIGCHSHFRNDNGVNVCTTNKGHVMDKLNCVSCHMPKVDGNATKDIGNGKHAYHGFAGIHNGMMMLSKYIDVDILKGSDRFFIGVINKAPHALTLHPMRMMELRVSVVRDKNMTEFQPIDFVRVLGVDENVTTPWKAKEILKNTSIKANEKRVSTYRYSLQKGDIVNVVLGYYLLNPKVSKMLKLDNNSELNKFLVIKQKVFNIDENQSK